MTLHALAALGSPALGAAQAADAARRLSEVTGQLKPQELVLSMAAANALALQLPPAAWADLLAHALRTAPAFSPRDCAALLHATAAAAAADAERRPGHAWLGDFLAATQQQVAGYNLQDLGMALYSLGRLRHQPPRPWLAAALRRAGEQRRRMCAGSVCMCLFGVSCMRSRPPAQWVAAMASQALGQWQVLQQPPVGDSEGRAASEQRSQSQPPQQQQQQQQREHLMLLWAFGRLRYRPPPSHLQALVASILQTTLRPPSAERHDAPQSAASADATPLDAARAGSTVLLALARIGYVPPRRMLAELLGAALQGLVDAPPQAFACTLYAAALLLRPAGSVGGAGGAGAGPWLCRALDVLQGRLGELTPQGLSMVAWAAVRLAPEARGGGDGSGSGGSSGGSGSGGGSGNGGGSGGGESGGSRRRSPAGAREWLGAVCDAAGPRLGGARPQAVAVLLWAAARAGHEPDEGWLAAALWRQAELAPDAAPQSIALTFWAAATLTHRQRLQEQRQQEQQQEQQQGQQQGQQQQQQQQQAQDGEGEGAQQERSVTTALWWRSEAVRAPLAELLATSTLRLSKWRPQDLAMAAWALSRLRLRPQDAWMARFYATSGRKMAEFRDQELAVMAWALLRLLPAGARPPTAWVASLRDEAAARRARGDGSWRGRDARSVAQAVAVWLRAGGGGGGARGGAGGGAWRSRDD
ncbi:hypothetical protein MNEG_5228 [Monoraphidium neglectum]|uniref:Uncharacterized protein n=1 Tax=Monoraphidium neglectum TaxID=145388 RepID=A0A0D2NB64_9CHLO|nr:hypothetical protein MNEG_5228 [Monoraphidium neglectum]KIZ02731.1 hypothetical protein MNEG_5228 [Monoraphidium neglectum]|eukprot:XP_013901750.1 hypothetical protein MNEG_5228 [Monoraphidium neglectum]